MKTIAAIIMATTTLNPQQVANLPATHMVQNSPQIQNMHLNAIVPTICSYSSGVVTHDAISLRIKCNEPSVMFVRVAEQDMDKMLPLRIDVGGNKTYILTKDNYDNPVAELPPMHQARELRIRILGAGSRVTDLSRVTFVIRPTGI